MKSWFSGTLSRGDYWVGVVFNFILTAIVIGMAAGISSTAAGESIAAILYVAVIVWSTLNFVSLAARRCRDAGISALWGIFSVLVWPSIIVFGIIRPNITKKLDK